MSLYQYFTVQYVSMVISGLKEIWNGVNFSGSGFFFVTQVNTYHAWETCQVTCYKEFVRYIGTVKKVIHNPLFCQCYTMLNM